MKTVLLVEDDFAVRRYLKQMIPWGENGYSVIGEADNGLEALEIIRREIPDIMITDIQMPQLNGVELIRQIKEEGYHTKAVVLSFYDDFEYVRAAMKYGAADYVLKHQLTQEKILDILGELQKQSNVQERDETREENRQLKRHLQRNANAIKKCVFQKLLEKQKQRKDEIYEELTQFGIHMDNITYLVAIINLKDERSGIFQDEEGRDDLEILEFSVCNIVEEIIDKNRLVCAESGRNYWILLTCDGMGQEIFMEKRGYHTLNKIIEQLDGVLGIQAAVGMSKAQSNPDDIDVAFLQAEMALENAFYQGYESVYFYTGTCFSEDIDNMYRMIGNYFTQIDKYNNVRNELERLLDSFLEIKLRPSLFPKVEEYISTNLLSLLNRLEKDLGEKVQIKQKLHCGSKTYLECREKLLEIAGQIEELQEKIREETYERSEINNAIKYIRINYSKNITLNDISSYVNLSRGYFSQLFKSETGMSFTDYLNYYRISEAKKMLKENNLRVYEIAERVGIPDQHYFNRLFKNIVGVPPAKYAEK